MRKKDKKKTERPEPSAQTEDAGDYGLAAAEAEEDNAGDIALETARGTMEKEPEAVIIDREILILAPMVHGEMPGYRQRHVEVCKLTDEQAEALRRLTVGLNAKAKRLNDGRFITSAPDALRWLIERLVD